MGAPTYKSIFIEEITLTVLTTSTFYTSIKYNRMSQAIQRSKHFFKQNITSKSKLNKKRGKIYGKTMKLHMFI